MHSPWRLTMISEYTIILSLHTHTRTYTHTHTHTHARTYARTHARTHTHTHTHTHLVIHIVYFVIVTGVNLPPFPNQISRKRSCMICHKINVIFSLVFFTTFTIACISCTVLTVETGMFVRDNTNSCQSEYNPLKMFNLQYTGVESRRGVALFSCHPLALTKTGYESLLLWNGLTF